MQHMPLFLVCLNCSIAMGARDDLMLQAGGDKVVMHVFL